jgi:O-antigen ligase
MIGALMFVTARGWRFRWYLPLFVALVSLVVWIAVSIQWTGNPSVATRRLVIFILILIAAYGLVVKWPRGALLPFIVFASGLLLTLGLLSAMQFGAFAPFTSGYRFSGTLHPNGQGQLCATLALTSIAAFTSVRRNKLVFGVAALYGVTFLLLTKSLTSLAGFLAAITVFTYLRFSSGRRIRFVYLGVMVVLIGGLMLSAEGFSLDPIARATGRRADKMVTLTGRLPLWKECVEYISERPFIGYGFEGFWTPERAENIELDIRWRAGAAAGGAHSAYIDLWLALGIVGLFFHTAFLLLVLRRAAVIHRVTQAPEFAAAAGLSAQFLVFGALESTMIIRFSAIQLFAHTLFLMVALAAPAAPKNLSGERER